MNIGCMFTALSLLSRVFVNYILGSIISCAHFTLTWQQSCETGIPLLPSDFLTQFCANHRLCMFTHHVILFVHALLIEAYRREAVKMFTLKCSEVIFSVATNANRLRALVYWIRTFLMHHYLKDSTPYIHFTKWCRIKHNTTHLCMLSSPVIEDIRSPHLLFRIFDGKLCYWVALFSG